MEYSPSWRSISARRSTAVRSLVVLLVAVLAALAAAGTMTADLVRRDVSVPGAATAYLAAPAAAPASVDLAAERVLSHETVRVDAALLADAPASLWLELVPGAPRLALLSDFERTEAGGVVWRGRFPDDPPGYRSITLSYHGGVFVGSVEGETVDWALRPNPDGSTTLVSAARFLPLDCAVGTDHGRELVPVLAPASGTPAATAAAGAAAAAGEDLSIMVLVSPHLTTIWGGRPYAVAWAHHAVDTLNTVFANSRIQHRAYLTHVDEWSGSSGNIVQTRDLATRSSVVAALRDAHAADLVAILVGPNAYGGCGVAHLMSKVELGPQFARYGISVSRIGCDSSYHSTFIHEIGHNLGAQHLPGPTAESPSVAVFPYAFGHYGTMMAGGYLQVFSSPRVTVRGQVVGVEGERDNARALDQTIPVVAAFRTGGSRLPRNGVPPPLPPPPTVTPGAPTDLTATVLSATSVRLRWRDNTNSEIAFRIDGRVGGGAWQELDRAPLHPDDGVGIATRVVEDLEPATTYTFRVIALGEQKNSKPSNEARATTRRVAPAAPAELRVEAISPTAVRVYWSAAEFADGYEVELHGADPAADRGPFALAHVESGSPLGQLEPGTPYTFRVRAVNAEGASGWSDRASVTTPAGATDAPCVADADTLCLLGDRFEVEARWRNPHAAGGHGVAAARAAPASERTGLFTFFDPDNVELVVKMLDGRTANGAFWHFYGALSDVEYWVSVRDTVAGAIRTYHNPPFEQCGRGDTTAFVPPQPEPETGEARRPAPTRSTAIPVAASPARASATAEGTCVPGPHALCLAGGRFRVEVAWENPHGDGETGVGSVYAGLEGDRTGHFWFFRPDNLEVSVKILDGRALNDHFWIFWGALSDVGYTLRVTDTVTDQVHELVNEPRTLCGGSVNDLL